MFNVSLNTIVGSLPVESPLGSDLRLNSGLGDALMSKLRTEGRHNQWGMPKRDRLLKPNRSYARLISLPLAWMDLKPLEGIWRAALRNRLAFSSWYLVSNRAEDHAHSGLGSGHGYLKLETAVRARHV